MKCIKHGEVIKRVTDEEADKQVSAGLASYCSRGEWKEKVRGPVKVKTEEVAVKKVKKAKASAK